MSLAYFTTIQCSYYLVCEPKNPCMHDGTCAVNTTEPTKPDCTCAKGYTGDTCEKPKTGNTTI